MQHGELAFIVRRSPSGEARSIRIGPGSFSGADRRRHGCCTAGRCRVHPRHRAADDGCAPNTGRQTPSDEAEKNALWDEAYDRMKSKDKKLAKKFEKAVVKAYCDMVKDRPFRGACVICDPDWRPAANPAGGQIRLTSYKTPRFVA